MDARPIGSGVGPSGSGGALGAIRASTLALCGFLMLYPLDLAKLAFQSMTGLAVPSGVIGIAAGLMLLPLCLSARGRTTGLRVAAVGLLLAPIGLAATSGRFEWSDPYLWIRAAALFSVGYFFMSWLAERPRGGPALRVALLACAGLCLGMPGALIDAAGGNYLRVGDAMMLVAFATLATCRFPGLYWVVTALSLACLYAVGSRYSLGVMAIAATSLGLLRHRLHTRLALVFISASIVGLGILFAYQRFLGLRNVHDDRLLRLLFASDLDTSLSVRNTLSEQAWSVFLEHPLLGDYRYYLEDGGRGDYAHNLLSLWSELGVLGVVLSVLLIGTAAGALWRSRRRLNEAVVGFAFLMAVNLMLGMLFAKSHLWTVMYFAFGGLLAVAADDDRVRRRFAVWRVETGPQALPGRDGAATEGGAATDERRS